MGNLPNLSVVIWQRFVTLSAAADALPWRLAAGTTAMMRYWRRFAWTGALRQQKA